MRHAQTRNLFRIIALLVVCLLACAPVASADGPLPRMAEPPSVPVYWRLTGVEQEPSVTPKGKYSVDYRTTGLWPDLDDALMAESLQEEGLDGATAAVELTISKDDRVMRHVYSWTAPPIYLEPGETYPITITGTELSQGGGLNSLLGVYVLGERVSRISAGGYTGHVSETQLDISTASGIFIDGSLVISLVLRDVDDMFNFRVTYTYTMADGGRPYPTPVPGFVAADVPEDVVPSYYDAVEGRDDLWHVTTAPDEYRAYGVMSGSKPGFFAADADGNVVMDAPFANPERDFADFVAGFVSTTPAEIPAVYPLADGDQYGFITRDGETILRAYGRIDGGPDAFYPLVDDTGVVSEEAEPVDPAADFDTYVKGFGVASPTELPAHYAPVGDSLFTFTGRDGEQRFRVYGRLDGAEPAFYAAEPSGTIASGAKPVLPQDDFEQYIKGFDKTTPSEVPSFYATVDDGVYVVIDRGGSPVYRVYGVLDGQNPAFYAANASGNRIEGFPAIDPDDDFAAYIAGFVPADAPEKPAFYGETDVPGLWSFIDVDGQAQYRVYGSLHRSAPAYYPADAEGNVSWDALPVIPASDLATLPPPSFAAETPTEIPEHYTPVEGSEGLFSFIDKYGQTQYRAYGAFTRYEQAQFYPTEADGEPSLDAALADPEADLKQLPLPFAAETPTEVPARYEPVEGEGALYRFTEKSGAVNYRVYGTQQGDDEAGFYPADADGRPLADAEQTDPADDLRLMPTLFSTISAVEEPAGYVAVDGKDGLYSFVDKRGETVYRVYGTMEGNDEPSFYPADADGNLIEDAQPVDPWDDRAQMPLTFSSMSPVDAPLRYVAVEDKPGLYHFVNKQGETEYRVFGAFDVDGEPVFYPAEADGKPIDGAKPADLSADLQRMAPAVFTPAVPSEVPETYAPVDGKDGLYAFVNKSGETEYRAYGTLDGAATPHFFAADEEGRIADDATPVDLGLDMDNALVTPSPTSYASSVVTVSPTNPGNAVVTRVQTPGPEATVYESSVATVSPTNSGNPVVTRVETPGPAATGYAVTVMPEADVTPEAVPVVGRTVDVQPTETQPVETQPTETQSAGNEQGATAAGTPTDGGNSGTVSGVATDAPSENPAATKDATEAPAVETQEPAQEMPIETPPSPTSQPDETPANTSYWWIALIVAGVAAIGGGGYTLLGKRKK